MSIDLNAPLSADTPLPDTDRLLAEWLASETPTHEPPVLLPAVLARTALTRRRPAWRIPDWWLRRTSARPAIAERSPLAMLTATRLVVAGAIVALASGFVLSGVLVTSPPVDPGADGTLIVAADGSGEFTTIGDAVASASDGDTISIMPGHYTESVVVAGKDLIISGHGDRETVIVEAARGTNPDDANDAFDFAFFLKDSDSTLSNLIVIGQEEGEAISIRGTSDPTLEDLTIRLNGQWTGNHGPIWWDAGTSGVLRDSLVEGFMVVSSTAGVTIEDNELPATCIVLWDPGARATIRGNAIRGCPYEFGIKIEDGSAVIEGNDISIEEAPPGPHSSFSDGRTAILLSTLEDVVTVRDNDIHDSLTGIMVGGFVTASIMGNRVANNSLGVSFDGTGSTFRDNTVTGNKLGVSVTGSSPTLDGNTISGNETGLEVRIATPILTGNTICDNGVNVATLPRTQPLVTEGNEICPD